MKKPKCIFILSVISAALILIYVTVIFLEMFFPQFAVYILDLDSLYEYYDYELRFREEEFSSLGLYAAGFAPFFLTVLMQCDGKKEYSKKRGIILLVFSGIFFVMSFVHRIYLGYRAMSCAEPLIADNFIILDFLYILPAAAAVIFGCACAIEIFICAEGIYNYPKQKNGMHSVTKSMIALLLIVLGFYACLGISYWITGV